MGNKQRGALSGMPKIKIRDSVGHVVTKPGNEVTNNYTKFMRNSPCSYNGGMTKKNDRNP
jgi:hypothetical protein